ncbi:MAG: N-acetylmuramoyl-L-alanine amidase [Gammaproteobacteria bacterium]|nr:N-acetylmuramoyl-L-alanine amidase [Gammaproteobacteria bacterium]
MGKSSLLLSLSLCVWTTYAQAASVAVKNIRMWPAPDNTRLVFDMSGPVEHTLFKLHQPERIVIDLKNASLQTGLSHLDYSNSYVKAIRHARRNGSDTRVVLDLNNGVRPKSFVLKPQREYGHRLVIDLHDESESRPAKTIKRLPPANKPRDVLIAIDAGHGGEDPGAIGRRGTREKDVVYRIARKLEQLISKERGMKPIMVRRGDYFVPLKRRVEIARQQNADLFISIHADAYKKSQARGSSVYILSEGNASSDAARFLADSENNSDMIGGVSLDDKDDLTKMVLFDMAQNVTIEDSHNLAKSVLKGLQGVTHLHKHHVEQAGFRVLRAPEIPSILVETAFISNPREERNLRSPAHQSKLARAILNGVRVYFRQHAPKGTLLAQANRKHRISTGETLSEIAQRYQVSVANIKRLNGLRTNVLRIGQVLQIPYTTGS